MIIYIDLYRLSLYGYIVALQIKILGAYRSGMDEKKAYPFLLPSPIII